MAQHYTSDAFGVGRTRKRWTGQDFEIHRETPRDHRETRSRQV